MVTHFTRFPQEARPAPAPVRRDGAIHECDDLRMSKGLDAGQRQARTVLTTLMTAAFIEIRAAAFAGAHLVEIDGLEDSERIRQIADLFHNVPGEMNQAAESDQNYQAVLDHVWQWSSPTARRWLDGVASYHNLDRTSPVFAAWSE